MHIQSFVEEDGDEGNGDPAKPPGGRLTLVSLPYPLLCWRSRCCAIMWQNRPMKPDLSALTIIAKAIRFNSHLNRKTTAVPRVKSR